MKQIFIIILICLVSCSSQQGITTIEYVQRNFVIVASGNDSPEKNKILLVCFNKYFNQDRYPNSFVRTNKLDTINYTKNMAIEIFLGEQTGVDPELKIDLVEENKDNINVYYTYSLTEHMNPNYISNPFVVAQTPKSRKPIVFFQNGKQVRAPRSDIYIKN